MKNKGDMIARAVMAGLAYAAGEAMTLPGVPPWLSIIARGVTVVLAAGSPSLVGVKRTAYFKSATPGGAPQAVDPETPKKK